MIRINLLGSAPPKARPKGAQLEGRVQLLLLAGFLALAAGYLCYDYFRMGADLRQTREGIRKLQADLARLNQVQQEVATYEHQKAAIEQRIAVIQQLQQRRTGAQELLDVVAKLVNRTDTLWLTSLVRQGSSFTIEGQAGSINAVANFIAELKRSGYFEKVDIKETHQDPANRAVATFLFTLTAEHGGTEQPLASPAAGKG